MEAVLIKIMIVALRRVVIMDIEGLHVAFRAVRLLRCLAIFNDIQKNCLKVFSIILLKMVGSGGIGVDLHLNLRLLTFLPLIVHLIM